MFALLVCFVLPRCLGFDIQHHLASKSPYGDRGTTGLQGLTPPPATCNPIHINLLSRHGSRFPTKGSIREYLALEKKLVQLNVTNPAFSWLPSWKCPYSTVTAGQLLPRGEDELYALGKRLTAQFPDVFHSVEYNPRYFPIRTTQKPRAAQSGVAFGFSVFEGRGRLSDSHFLPFYIHSDSADSDKLLYFHENCQAYQLYLETKTHEQEYDKFVATRIPSVLHKVAAKLGATGTVLEPADVVSFYELCSLGVLAQNADTEFCDLFDEEDVELLEYADDLESYWKKFYGRDVNWQMSAQLLLDFVQEMDRAAVGDPKATRGSFRFAHGETLAPLLGLLGLFQDRPPLRHDLPYSTLIERKWRQSLTLPMGANLIAVLYNCSQEPVVKFLVNEAEVALPRCGGRVYCPLSLFKQGYAAELALNYDELCAVSDSGLRPPAAAVAAFFVITAALAVCAVCFKDQRTGPALERSSTGGRRDRRTKTRTAEKN